MYNRPLRLQYTQYCTQTHTCTLTRPDGPETRARSSGGSENAVCEAAALAGAANSAADVNDIRPLNGSAGIIQIKGFFVSDGSKLTPLEPSHYPSKLSLQSCYRNSESPGGGLRLSAFE